MHRYVVTGGQEMVWEMALTFQQFLFLYVGRPWSGLRYAELFEWCLSLLFPPVGVEPEPRGRDSVSSKQRNQSHKVVLSGCRFVCLFVFPSKPWLINCADASS